MLKDVIKSDAGVFRYLIHNTAPFAPVLTPPGRAQGTTYVAVLFVVIVFLSKWRVQLQ